MTPNKQGIEIEYGKKYRVLRDIPEVYTGGYSKAGTENILQYRDGSLAWYKFGYLTLKEGTIIYSQSDYDEGKWRSSNTPREEEENIVTGKQIGRAHV